MNETRHICEHPGCDDANTTPCVIIAYRRDFSVPWFPRVYGLRGVGLLWHLWRHGHVELPPERYCAEHAKIHGYCWGCGQFWAGCERFDFSPGIFCENCRESEYDDFCDDEWLWTWADYPGELLEVNDEILD